MRFIFGLIFGIIKYIFNIWIKDLSKSVTVHNYNRRFRDNIFWSTLMIILMSVLWKSNPDGNFWTYISIFLLFNNIMKFISSIIVWYKFNEEYKIYKEEQSRVFSSNYQKNYDEFEYIFGQYKKQNYNSDTQFKSNTSKLNDAAKLMDVNLYDDDDVIKKRYKKLAIKWHPDKWTTNTKENQKIAGRNFRKLNNAYDLIKKHKKRGY